MCVNRERRSGAGRTSLRRRPSFGRWNARRRQAYACWPGRRPAPKAPPIRRDLRRAERGRPGGTQHRIATKTPHAAATSPAPATFLPALRIRLPDADADRAGVLTTAANAGRPPATTGTATSPALSASPHPASGAHHWDATGRTAAPARHLDRPVPDAGPADASPADASPADARPRNRCHPPGTAAPAAAAPAAPRPAGPATTSGLGTPATGSTERWPAGRAPDRPPQPPRHDAGDGKSPGPGAGDGEQPGHGTGPSDAAGSPASTSLGRP